MVLIVVLPRPPVVIKNPACPAIVARIAEAGVDSVFALVSVVTRYTLAAVLLEADEVTGAAMLAWKRKTNVAFGEYLWISLV